jgi:poly-gamma-glutamate capsule biosynthesis protein CapA/YwtB (metallophosphatase superfamily)
LYESFVTDAREYVFLAEKTNGKIAYPVSMEYIWGDALSVWQEFQPDVKIVNLETAITQIDTHWPNKDIHYRMNPRNASVLSEAKIDICMLANNHILDWN